MMAPLLQETSALPYVCAGLISLILGLSTALIHLLILSFKQVSLLLPTCQVDEEGLR